MKNLVRNLYYNPKVFLMLMLICLCPLIHIIWACPSPDCSAEAEALAAAAANLSIAEAELQDAQDTLEAAWELVLYLQAQLQEEQQEYADALDAFTDSLTTPFWPITYVLLMIAKANLENAQTAYDNSLSMLADAQAAVNSALSALNSALDSYLDAMEAYRACLRS